MNKVNKANKTLVSDIILGNLTEKRHELEYHQRMVEVENQECARILKEIQVLRRTTNE